MIVIISLINKIKNFFGRSMESYFCKVYYEDTDATGRVYHSNYLKYLERGRSEFLYKLGYNHKNLLQSLNFYFVVKHVDIDFKLPAYFEDILDVKTKINEITKVKIIFNQSIFREKDLLIDSKILIIPVNDKGKIVKMPVEMLEKLQLPKI